MDRSQKVVELLSQLHMLEQEIAMTEVQLNEINTMSHYVRHFIESTDVRNPVPILLKEAA
jgi:prefoldin subunit 5